MQEERTSGPHSYLAGYLLLAFGGILAIVIIVVAMVKNFWGDKPLEKCDMRVDRLAARIQADYVAEDGLLPEDLEYLRDADLTRCPYCKDDEMATANYRFSKLSKDEFRLQCKYEAHRMLSLPILEKEYRASLTEGLKTTSGGG